MSSSLEEMLADIAAAELDGDPVDEVREQVRAVVDDASLEFDDAVPPWLHQFFRALRDRQTIEPTPLPERRDDDGDVWELFPALEEVEPFDCLDHGEWIRLRLRRLGMLGLISIEHNYFRVLPLADVTTDRGDLHDAATLDRPER